jgi:hypothetical protein
MSKPASDVIDEYYERLKTRMNDWTSHVDDTRELTKKIVKGDFDSWHKMFAGILANGIHCYDTAFGWMYPGNPSSTKTSGNPSPPVGRPTAAAAAPAKKRAPAKGNKR